MQVKEYKTPEEALKEVEDPIIRSAIEPLSDKVAEMRKNCKNLREAMPVPEPLPLSKVRRVIDSIDDVIEILMHYKKMLNKAYCEMPYHELFIDPIKVQEVDEYLFTNEIDYLYARVNEYLNLNLCKPLPYFQKLVDYSRILYSARNIMEAGYVDIVSRTTSDELLSNDLHITTLLEIAINYKAKEHEGKQD